MACKACTGSETAGTSLGIGLPQIAGRRFRPLSDMSRRLRFVPEGGGLVEVTCRTIHGRLRLLPSHDRHIAFDVRFRSFRLPVSSAEPVLLPTAFPAELTPSEEDRPDGTC